MGTIRTHNKKRAHCAHPVPSFVYRQDGYELSYEFGDIILPETAIVKKKQGVATLLFIL